MASVFDFAAQIQARLGSVDSFRMNKLVYYVQAWSLVWNGRSAFSERIEAWIDGPVTKSLWVDVKHNDSRRIRSASPLSADDADLVEKVLFHYGRMSADELIKLTHAEEPWLAARGALHPRAQSSEEISVDVMRDYYSRVWKEVQEDNRALAAPPALVGSADELEKFLQS